MRYTALVKSLKCVALTRQISSTGKVSVQALNKPLSAGRYGRLHLVYTSLTRSKYTVQVVPPSCDIQTTLCNTPVASAVCSFTFSLWRPFRLIVCREQILGR